jgi:hypothetical protein
MGCTLLGTLDASDGVTVPVLGGGDIDSEDLLTEETGLGRAEGWQGLQVLEGDGVGGGDSGVVGQHLTSLSGGQQVDLVEGLLRGGRRGGTVAHLGVAHAAAGLVVVLGLALESVAHGTIGQRHHLMLHLVIVRGD